MASVWLLVAVLLSAQLITPSSANWVYFANTNDVPNSGPDCQNASKPYICLGTTLSLSSCQNACVKWSAKCAVFTWSATSNYCWTRTDGIWSPTQQQGITAACNDAIVGASCSNVPYNGPITASVNTSQPAGVRSHPLSPAVTLDFWRPDDPRFGQKWGNSSALFINLADPQLRALASALAPAILRLGGSPEDSLVFSAKQGDCKPMSAGNGPFGKYFCSQVHPYEYDCLTTSRWNALLQFASETGLKIALGLNGCYGRPSATQPMDFSNIQVLLEATAASPYVSALWGFEFTNEVVPNTIDPKAWAADLVTIKKMAASIFTAKNLPVLPFVGPDQVGWQPIAAVAPYLPPHFITAFTYHQYPQCILSPGSSFVLEPSCLLQIDGLAQAASSAAQRNSKGGAPYPSVWAGETADHSGGGIAGLTDTFRSSFYYAWQLGALPLNGVELGARQCLSGGDYELLTRTDFSPNPDYFIVWLFKNLIGGGASAYNVTISVDASKSGVRLFAFSAAAATKGKYTLLAINLQDGSSGAPIAVTLTGALSGRARVEYHITGDPTAPHGPIACNGHALGLAPGTHLPPPWEALGVAAQGPLFLQPGSIVFATVL